MWSNVRECKKRFKISHVDFTTVTLHSKRRNLSPRMHCGVILARTFVTAPAGQTDERVEKLFQAFVSFQILVCFDPNCLQCLHSEASSCKSCLLCNLCTILRYCALLRSFAAHFRPQGRHLLRCFAFFFWNISTENHKVDLFQRLSGRNIYPDLNMVSTCPTCQLWQGGRCLKQGFALCRRLFRDSHVLKP